MAQQHGQKTFSSPEDASNALVKAAQDNDEKTMIEILGPDAKQIVSSGDDAEDADSRANFVEKYKEMHRLVKESDVATVLYIGGENWPTPIPLVNKGKSWYFDTEEGKKEILYRRVGRNEMSAIRICQELVAAQKEHYSTHHNEYAQKIFSDEGQHNGLYWTSAGWEPQSPIGPLVASAVAKGRCQSSSWNPDSLPWLLLRDHNPSGEERPRRRKRLHRKRQDDRRLRLPGLPCRIQIVRRDDIHRQREWHCVAERSRP